MNANHLKQTQIHLDVHKILQQLSINDKKLAQLGIVSGQMTDAAAGASPGPELVAHLLTT